MEKAVKHLANIARITKQKRTQGHYHFSPTFLDFYGPNIKHQDTIKITELKRSINKWSAGLPSNKPRKKINAINPAFRWTGPSYSNLYRNSYGKFNHVWKLLYTGPDYSEWNSTHKTCMFPPEQISTINTIIDMFMGFPL